jgi:arsenate reductase
VNKELPITVLFVCVHNAGRSQMAEAIFNHLAQGRYRAASAGTMPKTELNPRVVQVLAETGLDIRGKKPRLLTPEMVQQSRRVITMGCGASAACPALFINSQDWGLADPANMTLEEIRLLKEEIQRRVTGLIDELGGLI